MVPTNATKPLSRSTWRGLAAPPSSLARATEGHANVTACDELTIFAAANRGLHYLKTGAHRGGTFGSTTDESRIADSHWALRWRWAIARRGQHASGCICRALLRRIPYSGQSRWSGAASAPVLLCRFECKPGRHGVRWRSAILAAFSGCCARGSTYGGRESDELPIRPEKNARWYSN
jgi:hypothetical protein